MSVDATNDPRTGYHTHPLREMLIGSASHVAKLAPAPFYCAIVLKGTIIKELRNMNEILNAHIRRPRARHWRK